MMEPDTLLELMRTRRSIRRFVDRSVPPGLLEKILEVGRWAPSNHNRQGYRFLVVEDSEELRAIANRVRSSLLEKFHRSARWPDDLIDDFVDHAAWFGAAPCAIVVFHRRPVAVAGALLEDVPGADVVSGEPLSAAWRSRT